MSRWKICVLNTLLVFLSTLNANFNYSGVPREIPPVPQTSFFSKEKNSKFRFKMRGK